MATIKIIPSMIFDAICTIEYLNEHKFQFAPEQIAFSKKINEFTSGRFKKGGFGKTNTCLMIASYFGESTELEKLTLDDLSELFKDPQNVYNEIIKQCIAFYGEDYKKHLEEMQFNKIWESEYLSVAVNYSTYINILAEIKFEKLWQSDLLPIIKEEAKNKEIIYNKLDIDSTLVDIQKLKKCDLLGDVKIYLSFMSYPTALKLPGNSFLSSVDNENYMGAGLICHELMHGFASKDLNSLYLEYIKNNKYLMEQHDILINNQRSSIEEEFVNAAEYYLRMKHNGEYQKDLLKEAKERYGGCLPTSVFLFDLLSKEPETPNGYLQWLTDIFINKKLPQDDIKQHLDNITTESSINTFA